ncbi:MAG TPA: Coenzyme F420 hydrogenase/dehydrogenase, beta subunit C-terminal domain [Thermoguttaceae bacterium]
MTTSPMNILETVVRHGYCSSCGVCAAVCPHRQLQMKETEFGEYNPAATGHCAESCSLCMEVCPFSNEHCEDEDTLGKELFGSDANCVHHASMGWVRDSFVGAVADEARRLEAPSGGLTTAVLCHLLKLKQIDAAIVLQPLDERPWYRFAIVQSEAQVLDSRGSVYHVAPFDKVISDILAGPDRSYAVVALPCAAKAFRLAQKRLPALRRRIRYILGLTCSGYRSLLFADLMTALMGRSRGVLRYRSKRHARNGLDFRAELKTGHSVRSVKMLGLFGYLWTNEVGILRSCHFCDDVFAELADATFMDAWLPEYQADRRGTSLVISRSEDLSRVLTALFASGECEGGPIAAKRIEQSQIGVVHRRRDLMAARCQFAAETLPYVPKKRLAICPPCSPETDRLLARRELAFFQAVRNQLPRLHQRIFQRPGWLARWYAWWLCWKILLIATRHGFLAKTLSSTKYLLSKFFSSKRNSCTTENEPPT